MKKTSTPTSAAATSIITSAEPNPKNMPSKRTLDFIRSFARAYHAEPRLATALSGMVMN